MKTVVLEYQMRAHSRLKNSKIAARILDIIPCIIDLSLPQWPQQPISPNSNMTICRGFICSEVNACGSVLVVYVAREIPVECVAITSDAGARGLGDVCEAVAVHLLEQKRGIIASKIPPSFEQRIRLAIESSTSPRVFEP